jgi:hypothetical protein
MNPDFIEGIKREVPSAELLPLTVRARNLDNLNLLAPYAGRVNAEEFEGRPPTTVLFAGSEVRGSNTLGKLIFVYRPEGWNTLFRPETQRWEEVRHAETGAPLYQSADFGPLSALKVPEPEPWFPEEVVPAWNRCPGLHVEADLDSCEPEGQPRTLLVVARNVGTDPVPALSVHWVYRNEAPQPVQLRTISALGISGSLSLDHETTFEGTLAVGHAAAFVLDARAMAPLLSQVAALSPERYWLSVRSGTTELLRVEGAELGAHLEELAGD